ncbi:hypothetical protein Cri9333_3787 [Crinalium epipsammum PCC 9333]|uniref:Uncharacterized protein n=2 Tax=Crinalium TaxID=241421 RepID=K9W4C9_9CYAN|nr:hypothetical protein Cri9333_3787 [Crinalium epipsammum PCC 9333]
MLVVSDQLPFFLIPMTKKLPLLLSLLASIVLTGSYSKGAIAQPTNQAKVSTTTVQLAATETQTKPGIKLTVQDLPAGFQPLSPEVATVIATQLEAFKEKLNLANIKTEDVFAFINPDTLQVIVGMTANLPTQTDQARFDASLQDLKKPAVQEQMVAELKEQLKSLPQVPVEVVSYNTLTDMDKLATTSTGLQVGVNIIGQSVNMDLGVFRRENVGALTAVLYMKGDQPALSITDAARKLDSKIIQSTANR